MKSLPSRPLPRNRPLAKPFTFATFATFVTLAAALAAFAPASIHAQPFTLTLEALTSGNSTSTGGSYTLDSTVGEVSAGWALSRGGPFSLAGGFWGALTPTAPDAGAPLLAIQVDVDTLRLSWPFPSEGFILEHSASTLGPWAPVETLYTTNATEISTFTVPSEPLRFFRLRKP